MTIKKIGSMGFSAQDGAIWGDFMFRFDHAGHCRVYDARALDTDADDGINPPQIAAFSLNAADAVIPHCNAVTFGCEYYAEGDEFPLMYANIYNNYAKADDRLEGMCCVYRLQREGLDFRAELVQLLKIGFAHERGLWLSEGEVKDVRPYGNFVVDRDNRLLHAFVMRDGDRTTRYFTFRLPALAEGEQSAQYGVRVAVLDRDDILSSFDTPYHLYIQGACCEGGLIYSSEGFNADIPPSIRVIDPTKQLQIMHANLADLGYPTEAEWIDFRGGRCFYSDGCGDLFEITF
ncbi:MAG: hypothetical protein IKZ09_11585 [Clostridia bacterium]|nr:hypothetical protein [Clostridia bacterium]